VADTGGDRACPYWQDYDSLAGRVCFCGLAAFGKSPRPSELKLLGCNPEKRRECYEMMRAVMGVGCVPGNLGLERPGDGKASEPVPARRLDTA